MKFFSIFSVCGKVEAPALALSGVMVCRKIKLKNYYDPKSAGECGVAPFPSWKDLFCKAHALPALRCVHDLFLVWRCDILLLKVRCGHYAAFDEGIMPIS
jgi:hypothetical protein